MRVTKSRDFKKIGPYTYLIKHLPTGLLYHGVRYSNVSKQISPEEDFTKHYFGSSVSFKEIFSIQPFRLNPQEYMYRLCWTFQSIEDALYHEEKINKRLLERNVLVEKGLLSGSRFANGCYGKAIVQTEEVRAKQRESHNSLCDCGCGRTKAQCNAARSVETRKNDICKCRKIPECDGSITTYECAGIRCRDQRIYTLFHHKTGEKLMGTQIELAQKIGCQVSHINSLLKGNVKSARGYLKTPADSQVRVLNDIKVIRHKSFGDKRGSIKELASSIGASESHVGMLFNQGAKKVKTVKGWYNPEFNPDGKGGYGSGALKNRWWQNIKKQSSGSLTVWCDVKQIYAAWL